MPTTYPGDNFIPSNLIAGDTWQFILSYPNYPAFQGWTAILQMRSLVGVPSTNFTASVDPDGSDYDFLITPAQTAPLNTSTVDILYAYRVIVVGSGAFAGQQFTADPNTPRGILTRLTVTPNLGALTTYDSRSPDEVELTAIRATILAIVTSQVGTATYSGQTFTNTDLDKLRVREIVLVERIKQQVAKARVAAGLASGRNVQARFVDPIISTPGSGSTIQFD